MRGLFITFEGIDGSGKSTQVKLLREFLDQHGVNYQFAREPGGTALGEQVRTILLNPAHRDMGVLTEALLYSASRAQLSRQVLWPALEAGRPVLCDRFVDSSLCYQGFGGGLDLQFLRELNDNATKGLKPDLTFLFDLPSRDAAQRRRGSPADRIERKEPTFHERVREGYLTLARQEPERIKIVDATGEIDAVQRIVRRLVGKTLGLPSLPV
ncbi:MAG: dTMP kinase [Symbiobacteriia bacterium]